MTFTIPSFHLSSIGPWLTLTVTAILILVLDALSPKGRKVNFSWLAVAGLAVAAIQTLTLEGPVLAFMIFVVAACELAVAIPIVLLLMKRMNTLELASYDDLKG